MEGGVTSTLKDGVNDLAEINNKFTKKSKECAAFRPPIESRDTLSVTANIADIASLEATVAQLQQDVSDAAAKKLLVRDRQLNEEAGKIQQASELAHANQDKLKSDIRQLECKLQSKQQELDLANKEPEKVR